MRGVLAIIVWLAMLANGTGYDFIFKRPLGWPDGPIPLKLQLDAFSEPPFLSDGKSSWNTVMEEAVSLWNAQLARVEFTTFTGETLGDGNGENEVFFSSRIYGQRFGAYVLAVTTTWRSGFERAESDIIFNSAIEWDSYRGPLRFSPIDLRRVAIHELGHALGLDHPDQAGQVQVAIMNSRVSDLDTLAEDDIHGARALYPPSTSYQLSIQIEPPGSGAVIADPPPNLDGGYPAGTLVKLKARPQRRNRMAAWGGDENRTGRVLQFRVVDDAVLVANFSSNAAPAVTLHPRSQFSDLGDEVTFQVRAASGTPLRYQWQFDGTAIPDATSARLVLSYVTHADSGLYSCRISNARGQTVSKAARLVVDGY